MQSVDVAPAEGQQLAQAEAGEAVELRSGEVVTKGPKSLAGVRKVHLDPIIAKALADHLDEHVAASPDAYLFTGEKGEPAPPGGLA